SPARRWTDRSHSRRRGPNEPGGFPSPWCPAPPNAPACLGGRGPWRGTRYPTAPVTLVTGFAAFRVGRAVPGLACPRRLVRRGSGPCRGTVDVMAERGLYSLGEA